MRVDETLAMYQYRFASIHHSVYGTVGIVWNFYGMVAYVYGTYMRVCKNFGFISVINCFYPQPSSASPTMDDHLLGVLMEAKVPNEFIVYLKEAEINDVSEFALMAAAEGFVDKKIIDASGLSAVRVKHRVAITKAWAVCRARYEARCVPNFVAKSSDDSGSAASQSTTDLRAENERLCGVIKSLQSSKDKAVYELQKPYAQLNPRDTSSHEDKERSKRSRNSYGDRSVTSDMPCAGLTDQVVN